MFLCNPHYHRQRLAGTTDPPLKARAPKGTGVWRDGYYHPADQRTPSGKRTTRGRHVMIAHLGRDLVAGETVHHRNGNRADDRIENLELWSTQQPSGQRVADKVAYAREILALYGDLVDRMDIVASAQ